MIFSVEHSANYHLITSYVEKLNGISAPELKIEVLKLEEMQVVNVIIDLSQTLYCDSTGLNTILYCYRMCKDNNGKFIICNLQPNVKKLIEISQLHRILTITETCKEAEMLMDQA
ncbi:MAG: STAS domain-containing protein [Brumimicrobium sp.]|nr:STAS domain-containing protein [Brumimicrobium sp.]MCO5268797.1 STAS domain-containing protein [Brumimicrobium sp.]